MLRWRFALCAFLCWISLTGFGGTLAQFRTVFGDVEVELYDQDKPVTVQNFIRYVQLGTYQNEFAHRIVPGFIVQGGGFTVASRGTTNWAIASVPSFGNITNEFGVGRKFSNIYGTIAMAKLPGYTNSASSQWFINLGNNGFLDTNDTNNLFVVFGHVIKGTNILTIFNNFKPWSGTNTPVQSTNLDLQYYAQPFDDLPLLRPVLPVTATNSVTDTNFVYVDISLLQVAVKPLAGGTREISWNSATGLTNVVEFTTNMPPSWFTLVRTNGNGNRFAITDSTAGAKRFYRVRVEY
jgi:cyclophilin family peptidyl-prolyl cis-trans isomerase